MVHITNPFKNPLIRYGIIFSLIPFLVTYGLGHTLKNMFAYTLQNVAEMDATDPDRINLPEVKYIFPFACLSGIIAFIIWFFLMQKKTNPPERFDSRNTDDFSMLSDVRIFHRNS